MIKVTSCTKPIALTVQANPILPRSCLAIEGKMICRNDSQTGGEHQTVAQAGAKSLREEKLPECVAEGSHEDSEEGQDGTCSKGSAKVSGIGQTTGKGTNEEQGGNLDGADPDDLACGIGKMVGVVGLEDAKGAIVSPEVESAIWRRSRIFVGN
ncbi:hypothetical protein HG531_007532 [Fusarium graminearum]|nr:hypothetical protein HG531_007532 [Fusarium graminearum]